MRKKRAKYIHQPIPLPVRSDAEVVEQFWAGVTAQTRVIYISHITSPTALRLPVEVICQRARQAGILTLIDGAHAPGQIPLDLRALDADFYTGNCHKWMMAPKGAAFLHVRRTAQALIEPLVVSWGYGNSPQFGTGNKFLDLLQWTGTRDFTAALAVPDAIHFAAQHDWDSVRRDCHSLLRLAIDQVCGLTGLEPVLPLDLGFFSQMAIAPLPAQADLAILKSRLYDDYRVEVPLIQWQERKFVRISVQGYNCAEDVEALLAGLRALL